MTRLFRLGPVLTACLALGACAQLVGLDKFDENGEAGSSGSSGKGGSSGRGGSAGQGSAARGGDSGTGGASGGKAGGGGSAGTSVESGGVSGAGRPGTGGTTEPGGAGGMEEGGASGAGPQGGTGATGGTGGSIGNAGAGAGGESTGGCSSTIEITTHGLPELNDYTQPATSTDIPYYDYVYNIDPQIGSAATDDLRIDFYLNNEYDGDAVGVFQLGTGDEANFASCSRCVFIGQDEGSNGAKAYFYAESGTMNIASDSLQMSGHPDVQFTDVLFREVTIDFMDTNVSTNVPGGRCLHLATAALKSNVPAGWKCPSSAYGTSDGCDCGCGVLDPDCFSSYVGACDFCGPPYDTGSCATTDCSEIDLNDNTKCATNQGWTCAPASYGDGQSCDCGCGVLDYDCFDDTASSCDACDDPNSCTATLSGSCSDIDPLDNTKCN